MRQKSHILQHILRPHKCTLPYILHVHIPNTHTHSTYLLPHILYTYLPSHILSPHMYQTPLTYTFINIHSTYTPTPHTTYISHRYTTYILSIPHLPDTIHYIYTPTHIYIPHIYQIPPHIHYTHYTPHIHQLPQHTHPHIPFSLYLLPILVDVELLPLVCKDAKENRN